MKKITGSILVLAFFGFAVQPCAFANPSFVRAESGSIQIEENGSVYNIYSADRSIGEFSSFSNAAGETINSIQASASNTALFRVTGGEPSKIFGSLNANSRIFLVNPNGILFAPGSSVNAPGLVASALNISNKDFLDRNYVFTAGSAAGGVVSNQGILSGDYYVVLLGQAVRNDGTISSGGKAVLAAGNSARLLIDGEGLVSIDVTAAVASSVYDAAGNRVADAIANSGIISADGGSILMTAKAADGIFDNVINHSGVAQARSVGVKDGVVTLYGGDEGVVRVSGVIDASGKNQGEKGGTIHILGNKVGLFDSARIDASGDAGGGEVLIGGDYRGSNPDILNADFTYTSKDAVVDARAITSGDGGKVIVWANQATRFYGSIDARGGAVSGNGGFVETSGEYLDVYGIHVLASAANGNAGTWLLDPLDITISSSADGNFTQSPAGTFTPNNTGANIQDTTIDSALDAGTNVVITTLGTGVGGNGDILINALIKKTSGPVCNLTLNAARNIVFSSAIWMTGGGELKLNAVNIDFGTSSNINANGGATTLIASDSINCGIGATGNTFTLDGSLSITAKRMGNVVAPQFSLTNGAGQQVLDLNSTATTSGNNMSLTVAGTNFDAYKIQQSSPTNSITLTLPGGDAFSASGNTDVTLGSTNMSQTGTDPTLDYTLNGAGNILISGITLDPAKSLSIRAVNGSILDSSSSITAGNTTLRASGNIGTNTSKLNTTVSHLTAIAGGQIGLAPQNATIFDDLQANGNITISSANNLTIASAIITSDDDTKDITVNLVTGNLSIGIINTGGVAGDVSLTTAGGGSILDTNADDLNITTDALTLSSGSIGLISDPIEATYNSLSASSPNFITRIFPAKKDSQVGGLLIVGGRIVGGDKINDLTTSLYGQEDEDGETEHVITVNGASGGPSSSDITPPDDTTPPIEAKTFSPCGV